MSKSGVVQDLDKDGSPAPSSSKIVQKDFEGV